MKRSIKPLALITVAAIALTACNQAPVSGSEESQSESVTEASGDITDPSAASTTTGVVSGGTHSTKDLTEKGKGYEGTEGTGKFNYGEALQKSLLFYELQRSGKL